MVKEVLFGIRAGRQITDNESYFLPVGLKKEEGTVMEFISSDSFLSFLAHVGTGLVLLILGLIAFAFTTKFSEWQLIKRRRISL